MSELCSAAVGIDLSNYSPDTCWAEILLNLQQYQISHIICFCHMKLYFLVKIG
jgi:hypothetical protein